MKMQNKSMNDFVLVGVDSPAIRWLAEQTNPQFLIVEDKAYSNKWKFKKILTLDPLTIAANLWLKYSFNRIVPKVSRKPDLRIDRLTSIYTKGQRICLFGSSIVRPKAIAAAEEMVNLHLGILPDYRGCKPEVWAMAEGGDIGATLHQVVPEIDAGDIINQIFCHYTGKTLSGLKLNCLKSGVLLIKEWEYGQQAINVVGRIGNYYSTPPFNVIRWASRNLKGDMR